MEKPRIQEGVGNGAQSVSRTPACRMVAGMYANRKAPIGLHNRMGFQTERRLEPSRLLNVFPTPTPPKTK